MCRGRYRKLFRGVEGPDIEPVLGHGESVPLDTRLTATGEQFAAVVHNGTWYGTTILERLNGQARVRFLGYDSTSRRGDFALPDKVVNMDHIDLAGDYPPVEVESDGTWYPAVILERRGSEFEIHYVGYPDSGNEVVPPKRVRYPFADGNGERRSRNKKQ